MNSLAWATQITSLEPGGRSIALTDTNLVLKLSAIVLLLFPSTQGLSQEEIFDLGNLIFQRHKLLFGDIILLVGKLDGGVLI